MVLCTFFTSIAQIFLKKGAVGLLFNQGFVNLSLSVIGNFPLIIGCFLYGIAAIIFIIALKGGALSVLYPIIATSYFWVTILSQFYLGEKVSFFKWTGVLVIFLGISLVGLGGRNAD
ncbi:hypothetical protein HY837_00715 [archaeon]|nr:hypothetical protein [archaeon]